MVGCVLSQLKPSELYILSSTFLAVVKTSAITTTNVMNVELLGLYTKHM